MENSLYKATTCQAANLRLSLRCLLNTVLTVFANSTDPDQTSQSAASNLLLHCLPLALLGVSRLKMD